MVGSLLQSSSPSEKENKGENSHKACIDKLSCGRSLLIYRYLVCEVFIKTHILMSISTNIDRLNVYDLIDLYISLVNNSIGPKTSYWSTLFNYPHKYID